MLDRRWHGTKRRAKERAHTAKMKRLADLRNTPVYVCEERYIGRGRYQPVKTPYIVEGSRNRSNRGSYGTYMKKRCNRIIRRRPVGDWEDTEVLNHGSYKKASEYWWEID